MIRNKAYLSTGALPLLCAAIGFCTDDEWRDSSSLWTLRGRVMRGICFLYVREWTVSFKWAAGFVLFFGFTVDVDRAAAVWFLYFLYEGRSFFGWSKIRKGIFLMIHNSEKSNF